MTTPIEKPLVTVWVDKYVTGWDGVGPVPAWHTSMPLVDALSKQYTTDAHFVPYYVKAEKNGAVQIMPSAMRVTIQSLAALRANAGELWYAYGVADIDCADAHQGGQTPDEWREQMHAAVEQSVPGCCWYDTRGGMRVIWAWPDHLTPEQYTVQIGNAVEHLRSVGIPTDALKDWGRCHRLPYVVRDRVMQALAANICEPAVWSPPEAQQAAGSVWDGLDQIRDAFKLPDKILMGQRNTVLTSYAASLRAKNLDREAIDAALHEADLLHCDQPLQTDPAGEAEIQRIVDWACKLPAGPSNVGASPLGKSSRSARIVANVDDPPIDFPPEAFEYVFRRGDPSEIAEWMLHYIEQSCGDVRVVFDRGVLWRYLTHRGVFAKIDPDDLYPRILSAAGMKVFSKMTADGPKYVPLKLGSQTVGDVVRCMGMARFRRKFFSDTQPGIAFSDCFVKITANGIEKHPHSPDWACNIGYSFPWTDDPPTEWLAFLDDVFTPHTADDRRKEIQTIGEWLGASLAGFVALFQRALMLQGGGSNGKSQCAIVVEGCFPEGVVTHFAPQHLGSEYNRARLATSRLNVVTEVPASEINDVAASMTKSLISGEPMNGRHIRETPFDFVPTCGIMLVVNGLPPVKDYSHGWKRRFYGLPFDREFSAAEAKRDYGKWLLAQERDRVICWALRSAVALLARGYYEDTQAGEQLIEDWQRSSDDVADWLAEVTAPAAQGQGTDCPTLYSSYCLWCATAGIPDTVRLSRRQFFDRLKTKVKPGFGGPSSQRYVQYPLVLASNQVH